MAKRFQTAVALDRSYAQLSEMVPDARSPRVIAVAEQLPFREASFDLVCAAEAAHWFDWDIFVGEAFRVLRDRGVMAVWCYYLPTISPVLDPLINELYNSRLAHYIDERRRLMIDGYAALELPGDEFERMTFHTSMLWTFETMISNLRSSSVVNREIKEQGVDHVEAIEGKLRTAWGNAHQREATWALSLLICNRPVRRRL